MRSRAILLLLAVAALVLCAAPVARAADTVYWAGHDVNEIEGAPIDGSAGFDVDTSGATAPSNPGGVALDAADGKILWVNENGPASFANLDNTGGGDDLDTSGADINVARGVAIDLAGGNLWWANAGNSTIAFAKLDGSGGDEIDTTGATVSLPLGVAPDPADNRVYWTNSTGAANQQVSYANLDGSGDGQDIATTGTSIATPSGIALDPSSGNLYVTDVGGGGAVDVVNPDTGAVSPLNTSPGGNGSQPFGDAIDPEAGKVYWAAFGGSSDMRFANLAGGGGGSVTTTGSTPSTAFFPALLKAPEAIEAPVIEGSLAFGSTLRCTTGAYAPDLPMAHLSRQPESFAYQWSRDGAEIGGATSETLKADQAGSYTCKLTAANFAGQSSQTTAAHTVNKASNAFTFGPTRKNKKKGTATVTINVPVAGSLKLTGKKVEGANANPSEVGNVDLAIKAKGKAKKRLKKRGKAKVNFSVTFSPTGGDPRTEDSSVKLVKKH